VASTTVWAPTGSEADVASTALFVELSRREPARARPHLALLRRGDHLIQATGGDDAPGGVFGNLESR
jgi:hypothetical protein